LARIAATVRNVHRTPVRCGLRRGSAADGHGIPASLSARLIRAALWPASRWANIHRTTGAVTGSGSSLSARRPPAWVRSFAETHELSPLSRREALKHLS
jgi:hypothetical protein